MSDLPGRGSRDYARQLQEKFELYLLGLIFTLLALAVQTAKFGASPWADGLEVAGWIALLISGLVGLSRMEWMPVAHETYAAQVDTEAERDRLRMAAEQGTRVVTVLDQVEPADIQALIADRDSGAKKLEAKTKEHQASIRRKYAVHKWTFVAGLCLLMGARAAAPVGQLIEGLQPKVTPSASATSAPTPKASTAGP